MTCISPGAARWPRLLTERLGEAAPPKLWTLGNLDLLTLPKTALFCSAPAKSSSRPTIRLPSGATPVVASSAASIRP
jgi:hypothetical protein